MSEEFRGYDPRMYTNRHETIVSVTLCDFVDRTSWFVL